MEDQGQSPDPAALRRLDEKMARAMVNMAYLRQWGNTKAQPGAEGTKRRSESKALRLFSVTSAKPPGFSDVAFVGVVPENICLFSSLYVN